MHANLNTPSPYSLSPGWCGGARGGCQQRRVWGGFRGRWSDQRACLAGAFAGCHSAGCSCQQDGPGQSFCTKTKHCGGIFKTNCFLQMNNMSGSLFVLANKHTVLQVCLKINVEKNVQLVHRWLNPANPAKVSFFLCCKRCAQNLPFLFKNNIVEKFRL